LRPAPETRDSKPETDFYSNAIARIRRIMIVLGCVLTTAAFLRYGWHTALGFACGCAVAYLNFHWLKRGVGALADRITEHAADPASVMPTSSTTPATASPASNSLVTRTVPSSSKGVVVRFLLRYVLMGLAAYAILTVSPASLYGLLAGLFLPVAAIACEAAYEAYVALARGI
jgi:hypothetical protein